MINISVIFATYNGAGTLPIMLKKFCDLNIPDELEWEIIVVDNNSSDGTADVLSQYQDKLPLTVLFEENPGKNRCLNKALDVCKGELLIFTDDDIIPNNDWLNSYYKDFQKNPNVNIFGGGIDPYWQKHPSAEIMKDIPLGTAFAINTGVHSTGIVKPGAIWGPNMAIRHSAFQKGLRFNEGIGPAGKNYAMGSETDLLNKLENEGCSAYYCSDNPVQHIIREYQISQEWLKGRAFRAGRGSFHALQRESGIKACATILGYPRWVVNNILRCTVSQFCKALIGSRSGELKTMWEKNFFLGFASEYKKMIGKDGAR